VQHSIQSGFKGKEKRESDRSEIRGTEKGLRGVSMCGKDGVEVYVYAVLCTGRLKRRRGPRGARCGRGPFPDFAGEKP